MFGDEFQAAGNAAKNKLGLLEKNPLGYVMSSIMAGLAVLLRQEALILQSWSAGLCFLWGCVL